MILLSPTDNLLTLPLYKYEDINPRWIENSSANGTTNPQYRHYYTDACALLPKGNYGTHYLSTWQGLDPNNSTDYQTLKKLIVVDHSHGGNFSENYKGLNFLCNGWLRWGDTGQYGPWQQSWGTYLVQWKMYNVKPTATTNQYTGFLPNQYYHDGADYSYGMGSIPWIWGTTMDAHEDYMYCLLTYCDCQLYLNRNSANPYYNNIQSWIYLPFDLKWARTRYGTDASDAGGNKIYIPYCFAALRLYSTNPGTYDSTSHIYQSISLNIWPVVLGEMLNIGENANITLKYQPLGSSSYSSGVIDLTGSPAYVPYRIVGQSVTNNDWRGLQGGAFNKFDDVNGLNTYTAYIGVPSGGIKPDPMLMNIGSFTGPNNNGSGTKTYTIYLVPYYIVGIPMVCENY